MGVRDELEAGLERIKHGWFQGGRYPHLEVGDSPRTCAWLAVKGIDATNALHEQVERHTCWEPGNSLSGAACLVRFNNAETTTVDDVIELYKRAIVEAPLED